MSQTPFAMDEPRQKLANLAIYMPNEMDQLYQLGHFLSGYITPQKLLPSGFAMACVTALSDLKKGTNGWTGERITHSIAGYPSHFYELLHYDVPRIAKAIFPEEFADEVNSFFEHVLPEAAAI